MEAPHAAPPWQRVHDQLHSRLVVLLDHFGLSLADLLGSFALARAEHSHLRLELEKLLIGVAVILELLELTRQLVAAELLGQLG